MVFNLVLAVSIHDIILESGADVEFLEANSLQEGVYGVLGSLLHEISVPRELSFILTEIVGKIFRVDGLDLLGERAILVCVEIIINKVVIIVHMAHDLFILIVHPTKTFEAGEGKEISNDQLFQVIALEKLIDSMSVWNRHFTVLVLRVHDAHVNLNITLLDLKQGITILVQDAFKWTDESSLVLWR